MWNASPYTNTGSVEQFLDTGQFARTGTQWVAGNSGENAVTFDGINFAAGVISFVGASTKTCRQPVVFGGTALSQFATVGATGADTVTLGSGSHLVTGNTYRVHSLLVTVTEEALFQGE